MNRLVCLDGLRGVLAVYVMASHMAPFAAWPGWLQSVLSHGGAAVDIFFMLSGLVIIRSLAAVSWRARPFLIARMFRIYPVYLVVLVLAVAVQPLANGFERMPWIAAGSPARVIWSDGWPAHWVADIAAHLTMTHGLFPAGIMPDVWVSFLGAAWSLSTEWQFYILVLAAGYERRSDRIVRDLVALFLLMSVAGQVWQAVASPEWQFSRAFLPNKAQYFALGVASVRLLGGGSWRGYGFVLALVLVLSGLAGPEKWLPPLAWSACLAAERGDLGWNMLRRVLRSRVLVWFGALSYCIYLVNEPVQKLTGIVLARAAGGDGTVFTLLWCPLSLVLPVAVAVALHRWIEQPMLRRGRSFAQQSSPCPALPSDWRAVGRPRIAE